MKTIFIITLLLIAFKSFSQYKGKIAYSSNKSGYFEIYVIDLETNSTKQLTNRKTDMPDYAPEFTKDGKSITFTSYRKGGWRSWIMDENGDGKKFANQYNTYNGWTRISANNTKMVFQSYRPGMYLYLADKNGENLTILHKSGSGIKGFNATPAWSPNNREISFTADNKGKLSIYKIDSETRKVNLLTRNAENAMAPSYSPDGGKIIYTLLKNGVPQIYIMNQDGTQNIQLTQITYKSQYYKNLNGNDFVSVEDAIIASWSPDGNHIVYSKPLTRNIIELFIMDKNGENKRQLTFNNAKTTYPSWVKK